MLIDDNCKPHRADLDLNRVCFEQSRETSCWPPILSENWRMEIALQQEWVWLGGVIGFKTNCLHMRPGPTGGVPFVGVFLRDPSPYLREFRRKPQKTQNG